MLTVPNVFTVLGGSLVIVSGIALAAGAVRAHRRNTPTPVLVTTILGASGLLLLSIGWLTGPTAPANSSEAIKSGSLISAAVLALYALWLNDQRRRTEQERLETEKERGAVERSRLAKELEQLGLERVRIANERFTTAIELLGNESDRVRVGALIVLEGLARNQPHLIPDVLDQVCGYLRSPPAVDPSSPTDRERGVRARAQRVLSTVVRRAAEAGIVVDVDLADAVLHRFHLDSGRIGTLRLDGAHLTGPTRLRGVVVDELVMVNCVADDDVVIERDDQERGDVGSLQLSGNRTAIGGRLRCRCDLGMVEIDSVDFQDSVELTKLTVRRSFSAQAGFTRLTLTEVTFATPPEPHERSIDLFHCTFSGLVSFDNVVVCGATRLDALRFDGGLELVARFHNRVTTEQALVSTPDPTLPPGWRLGDHDAVYRKLVPPAR
ncbi:hypothetical protein [Actinophytocola glycyrrhizae]|uniref:Pentapeptide repeat-containing protein n=1 Tax=Actinophytocola glycyrrhizae TaxID=2044873 RepID=A0ABV9S6M1_9PSEU